MQHLLQAENISKKVGKKELLRGISLELKGGDVYGFTGENGAGKTMLFRILSGLVKPSEGRVLLDGADIHNEGVQKKIGVIIENSLMWPELTGMENLLFLSELNRFISKKEVMLAMERVGLEPDNELPLKHYSLGMKQRLMIAQAIMENPDFLFLDEPTNAIDQEGVLLARKIILEEAKRGAVVLLSSHVNQDISALCREVYQMNSGNCKKLYEGMKHE